jgi:rhodanese-related sulfurtransferase
MKMAKSTNSRQKKNISSANKTKSKVGQRKNQTMPLWLLALIVVGVFVASYLIIRNQDQKQPVVNNVPSEISVADAAKLEQQDWYFLDVREPSEWEEVHIPYATLIPLGELNSRLSEIPKDKNIVVVCRSGNRSAVGRDLLINSGFTNVTSMAGGMNTWQARGHPVVTGP